MRSDRRIAVIGLGYVGLPVAVAFARNGHNVVAFDVDPRRVEELRAGKDRTREVDAHELAQGGLLFTTERADLADRDFFIITVPTPIDEARRPDMSASLAPLKRSGVPCSAVTLSSMNRRSIRAPLRRNAVRSLIVSRLCAPDAISRLATPPNASTREIEAIGSRPSVKLFRRRMNRTFDIVAGAYATQSKSVFIARPQ